jgi:hypothetical protein
MPDLKNARTSKAEDIKTKIICDDQKKECADCLIAKKTLRFTGKITGTLYYFI